MGQAGTIVFLFCCPAWSSLTIFQAASPPSPLLVALTSLWPEVDKQARLTIKSEVKKQIGRRSPLYDHSCLHNAHSVLLLRLPSDSFRFIDSLYWATSIQNRFNKNKKWIYIFSHLFIHVCLSTFPGPAAWSSPCSSSRNKMSPLLARFQSGAKNLKSDYVLLKVIYHVLLFSVLTNIKPCLLQGLAALPARVSEDLFLCLVLLNPSEFWHCYKHWCNDSIVKEVALVDVFNTSKIVQNSVDHNQ